MFTLCTGLDQVVPSGVAWRDWVAVYTVLRQFPPDALSPGVCRYSRLLPVRHVRREVRTDGVDPALKRLDLGACSYGSDDKIYWTCDDIAIYLHLDRHPGFCLKFDQLRSVCSIARPSIPSLVIQ